VANFGSDVSTFVLNDEGDFDLDPYFREISGLRVVAEAVARRWTSPKGSLFWDPDACEDVTAYLNAKFEPDRIDDLQSALAAEAQKDERVQSASVLVTYEHATKRLRVRGALTPSTGETFQFVLSIDGVTARTLGLEVTT